MTRHSIRPRTHRRPRSLAVRVLRRIGLWALVALAGLAVLGHLLPAPRAVPSPASLPASSVAVHSEADAGSPVVAAYPVGELRILCGYGHGAWQVVTAPDGTGLGYAVVSDARCPTR